MKSGLSERGNVRITNGVRSSVCLVPELAVPLRWNVNNVLVAALHATSFLMLLAHTRPASENEQTGAH